MKTVLVQRIEKERHSHEWVRSCASEGCTVGQIFYAKVENIGGSSLEVWIDKNCTKMLGRRYVGTSWKWAKSYFKILGYSEPLTKSQLRKFL